MTEDYLSFLVAGGRHPWGQDDPASVNLLVDGSVVRSATGRDDAAMDWVSWDVSDLVGRSATIEVVDGNAGGTWGHLMVDSIALTSRPADPVANVTAVNLLVDGEVVRTATGRDSENLDWVSWDLADLQGRSARIQVVDRSRARWGHILADAFTLADAPAIPTDERTGWLDRGRDNYAGVTFNGLPDGRRVLIGWMSNWQYAADLPTSPWRGQMTLARELRLVSTPDGPRLAQSAVAALARVFDPQRAVALDQDGRRAVTIGDGGYVELDVSLGAARSAGVVISSGAGGQNRTTIRVESSPSRLVVDRTASGATGFSPEFPSVEVAPLSSSATTVQIYIDRASVEVFADRGRESITDLVFPGGDTRTVELLHQGATPQRLAATVTPRR